MSDNANLGKSLEASKLLDLEQLAGVSGGLSEARKDTIAILTRDAIANGWTLDRYLKDIEPYTSAEDREYVKQKWQPWKNEYEALHK